MADYNKSNPENYITLGNYLIDITTQSGKIFNNPVYMENKLIKTLADCLNKS